MTEIKKTWEIVSGKPPDILKPPFVALVKEGKTEVKPIVLCRECKHYTEHARAWVCDLTEWVHGGDWFCADGAVEEKGEDDA